MKQFTDPASRSAFLGKQAKVEVTVFAHKTQKGQVAYISTSHKSTNHIFMDTILTEEIKPE